MIADSITKLQTALRCWLARKRFLKDRRAAVSVQAWIRGEQVRATVGREMQELVRKRREKEAQEAEAARLLAEEKQKQLEEQALSVRLAQVNGRCGAGVLVAETESEGGGREDGVPADKIVGCKVIMVTRMMALRYVTGTLCLESRERTAASGR